MKILVPLLLLIVVGCSPQFLVWAVSVLDYESPAAMQKVVKTSIEKIFVGFPHSFNLNRSNRNF